METEKAFQQTWQAFAENWTNVVQHHRVAALGESVANRQLTEAASSQYGTLLRSGASAKVSFANRLTEVTEHNSQTIAEAKASQRLGG